MGSVTSSAFLGLFAMVQPKESKKIEIKDNIVRFPILSIIDFNYTKMDIQELKMRVDKQTNIYEFIEPKLLKSL